MYIIDLEVRENLASFLERIEQDEKKRAALLKSLAPQIRLGPVCETIEDALGYRTNEGAREWITQGELPEETLDAAVIRRANGKESYIPLYSLLHHVATHMREVSIDMVKPEWGIIRHAYIESKHLAKWEAAAKQAIPRPTNTLAASTQTERSQLERKAPNSGDSLTPIVWEICYDLHEAGKKVTAAPVMQNLRKMAEAKKWPLLSVVANGVKFEYEQGEESELSGDALRKRIDEWKVANGLKNGS